MNDDVALAGQAIQHDLVGDRLDGKRKAGMVGEGGDVVETARRQVVNDRDPIATRKQRFGEVAADKAGPAGDQGAGHEGVSSELPGP